MVIATQDEFFTIILMKLKANLKMIGVDGITIMEPSLLSLLPFTLKKMEKIQLFLSKLEGYMLRTGSQIWLESLFLLKCWLFS